MRQPYSEEEIERFKRVVRTHWGGAKVDELETAIYTNQLGLQQMKARIEVQQEILNERTKDNKSKQFAD